MDNQTQPPGELLTCDVCGQQPESIAFDPDECRDECPFRKEPVLGNAVEGRQLELRGMRMLKNILNVVAVTALLPVYFVIGLWLLLKEQNERRRRMDKTTRYGEAK